MNGNGNGFENGDGGGATGQENGVAENGRGQAPGRVPGGSVTPQPFTERITRHSWGKIHGKASRSIAFSCIWQKGNGAHSQGKALQMGCEVSAMCVHGLEPLEFWLTEFRNRQCSSQPWHDIFERRCLVLREAYAVEQDTPFKTHRPKMTSSVSQILKHPKTLMTTTVSKVQFEEACSPKKHRDSSIMRQETSLPTKSCDIPRDASIERRTWSLGRSYGWGISNAEERYQELTEKSESSEKKKPCSWTISRTFNSY